MSKSLYFREHSESNGGREAYLWIKMVVFIDCLQLKSVAEFICSLFVVSFWVYPDSMPLRRCCQVQLIRSKSSAFISWIDRLVKLILAIHPPISTVYLSATYQLSISFAISKAFSPQSQQYQSNQRCLLFVCEAVTRMISDQNVMTGDLLANFWSPTRQLAVCLSLSSCIKLILNFQQFWATSRLRNQPLLVNWCRFKVWPSYLCSKSVSFSFAVLRPHRLSSSSHNLHSHPS